MTEQDSIAVITRETGGFFFRTLHEFNILKSIIQKSGQALCLSGFFLL
jgi:hypothetical protein